VITKILSTRIGLAKLTAFRQRPLVTTQFHFDPLAELERGGFLKGNLHP
jgi:hypothetical protein